MTQRKATISDIATAAGVSKTTVSRYINGREDLLSDSARMRVKKAIEQASYVPSAAARNLKEKKLRQVGIVLADIATPFSTALVSGAGAILRQAGYGVVACDAANSLEAEAAAIDGLLQDQVDGLIVNTVAAENPLLARIARGRTAVVLCDRYVNDCPADVVANEYCDSTLELMAHLREQGFGRVVLVTEPFENNSPRYIRMDAFLDADRRLFGAKDPESDVRVLDLADARAAHRLFARICAEAEKGTSPTAVFATNTATLIAAHRSLTQAGSGPGRHVGLCGPDEWEWARQMGWDWAGEFAGGITTLESYPAKMGEKAARLLLRRIASPKAKPHEEIVPVRLRARASTLRASWPQASPA